MFLSKQLFFSLSVPPQEMYIVDDANNRLYAIAGPYSEESSMSLTCIARNGK